MQTTILKPSQKLKAQSQKQTPKAKAKGQKRKAKSQMHIRDFSSKMQQTACTSEILAPKMQQMARKTAPRLKNK